MSARAARRDNCYARCVLSSARSWAWLASGTLAFACGLNPQPDLPNSGVSASGGSGTTAGTTSNVGGSSAGGSINLGLGGNDTALPGAGGQGANEPPEDAAGAGGAAGGETGASGESAGGAAGASVVK